VKLVTRSEWGARAYTCSSALPPNDGLVVHYSAADADEQADHANCDERVRGIQSYHMNTKGWCDIAYNFLVCKHGYIFEGRGWSRKAGATGDANSHTIAICFLGDDTASRDDVTAFGREALGEWIRTARARLNPNASVKGHRDYMSTSCPGNELETWVNAGGWKAVTVRRVRFELWARRKVDGKWKPYLVDKSVSSSLEDAPRRFSVFHARVSPKVATLAVRNRRPAFRRVLV
jgi:hypothetical protein